MHSGLSSRLHCRQRSATNSASSEILERHRTLTVIWIVTWGQHPSGRKDVAGSVLATRRCSGGSAFLPWKLATSVPDPRGTIHRWRWCIMFRPAHDRYWSDKQRSAPHTGVCVRHVVFKLLLRYNRLPLNIVMLFNMVRIRPRNSSRDIIYETFPFPHNYARTVRFSPAPVPLDATKTASENFWYVTYLPSKTTA